MKTDAILVFKSALEYFALRLGDSSPGAVECYRWSSIPRGWKRAGDERLQIDTAPLVHHGRQLLTPRGLVVNVTATLKLDGSTPISGVLLDRYGARDILRVFGNPFAVDRTAPTVDRTAPTADELAAEQDARQARAEEAERVSDAHDKREGEGWK